MKSIQQIINEKLKLANVIDYNDYIMFEALENSTVGFYTYDNSIKLEYSHDCKDWYDWYKTKQLAAIELKKGNCLYVRGFNKNFAGMGKLNKFEIYGKIKLSGNIMSLLYGNNLKNENILTSDDCFKYLFEESPGLYDASNLMLPAEKLTDRCYHSMFKNCVNLVKGPKILPAKKLKKRCYGFMFYGCESLEEAPDLMAIKSESDCYRRMFKNCKKLNKKPIINFDISNNHDCFEMFKNCPCEYK